MGRSEGAAFLAFKQFGDEYGQSGAFFDGWMFYDIGSLGSDAEPDD